MADLPPTPIEQRRARRVLIALGLGALGAFAAALATSTPGERKSRPAAARVVDLIEPTLVRCQTLGDAALGDAGCRAAWAEHRRRFLARGARP